MDKAPGILRWLHLRSVVVILLSAGCTGLEPCQGQCSGVSNCTGGGNCNGGQAGSISIQNAGSLQKESSEGQASTYIRRSFDGFSIAYQGGTYWTVINQSPGGISLSRSTHLGGKHTVIALAYQTSLAAKKSLSDLLKEVKEQDKATSSYERFSNSKYTYTTVAVNGAECVKSVMSADDHGVPYDLGTHYILDGSSLCCIYPESPSRMIVLGYSQRRVAWSPPLTLDAESQQWIDSLRFKNLNE